MSLRFYRGFIGLRSSSLLLALLCASGTVAGSSAAFGVPVGPHERETAALPRRNSFERPYSPAAKPAYIPSECSWDLLVERVFLKLFPGYSAAGVRAAEQGMTFVSAAAHPESLRIIILDEARPNAFARKGAASELYLTAGLLKILQNEDEVGFVLAHEMAHLRLDHFAPELPLAMFTPEQILRINKVHKSWEVDADQHALSDLEGAGYRPDAGADLLERLSGFDSFASGHFGRRHPGTSERILMMKSRLERAQLSAAEDGALH